MKLGELGIQGLVQVRGRTWGTLESKKKIRTKSGAQNEGRKPMASSVQGQLSAPTETDRREASGLARGLNGYIETSNKPTLTACPSVKDGLTENVKR